MYEYVSQVYGGDSEAGVRYMGRECWNADERASGYEAGTRRHEDHVTASAATMRSARARSGAGRERKALAAGSV